MIQPNKETYDYTTTLKSLNKHHQQQRTLSSTSNESQENARELVVSINSAGSSCKRTLLYPTSTIVSNTSTKKLRDNLQRQVIVCDKLTHQKLTKNQRMFSCLLVQQYFFYFVLLAFIVVSSFGFYYVIVTTNMRIEALENMLNKKFDNRVQLRFISSKDYFSDYTGTKLKLINLNYY